MKRLNHRSWRATVLACVGASFALCGPTAAADTSTDEVARIETIVVTSQHRKERLQDVPVSVQVIGGQVQFEQNLNSLEALTQEAPAVHIGATSSRSNEMFIRGIGSGGTASFDQAVGIFIDGIYHGRSRVTPATFDDLERVEILKGPQSTFFGNNAIAGAFNIVTTKPSFETDASARIFYGQYGQYTMEAAGGRAISDTIAARVAVIAEGMNGWMRNVTLGTNAPKTDNIAGRATLLFKPSADLDVTLKIEGSNNKNDGGMTMQIANCPPQAPFKAAGWCNLAIAQGINAPGINEYANSPGGMTRLQTKDGVLNINFKRGGHTFTSLTGYYSYDFNLNLDVDGLPATLFTANTPEQYRQFSQEFRIASPTNQPIEYLGGVYFQSDKLSVQADSHFYFFDAIIKSAPPFKALIPYLPLGQIIDFNQKETVTSVFGAMSWNATPRLKLTGELRGSQVKKDIDGSLVYGTVTKDYGGTGATPLPASVVPVANATNLGVADTKRASRTDTAWMPSAKIQYKITDASMGYASYTKGFLAGGFSGFDNSGVASRLPFAPEYVNAYEVGVKSKWDKFLLNLSLFRSNYTDLQVSANRFTPAGTTIQVIANAASAVSQGLELDGQWAVTPAFRLAAAITYLDAHYVSYPEASPTTLQSFLGLKVQDMSGMPTQFSPKWSGSVSGTYKTLLANNYKLTTELRTYFSSSWYGDGSDDELKKEHGYAMLGGRLGLETPDHKWAFDLIGRNLNNRSLRAGVANMATSTGSNAVLRKMPRSIGVQARYNF